MDSEDSFEFTFDPNVGPRHSDPVAVMKDDIEQSLLEGKTEFSKIYCTCDPLRDANRDIEICKHLFPECMFSTKQADMEKCTFIRHYSPRFLELTIDLSKLIETRKTADTPRRIQKIAKYS